MFIKRITVLTLIMLILSCHDKKNQKNNEWEVILKAVKNKNIEYLLKISEDSLQCLECNNGESWVNKERFFRKNINQMSLASSKNYTLFVEGIKMEDGFNKRIRISYFEKHKGNEYTIIYSILTGENKVKFLGVFSVP